DPRRPRLPGVVPRRRIVWLSFQRALERAVHVHASVERKNLVRHRLRDQPGTVRKQSRPQQLRRPNRLYVLILPPARGIAAAHLRLARTIAGRAERIMVELAARPNETVSIPALHYIKRLSDFLFVAGRYVNDQGRRDVLWVPGQNR